MTCPTIKVQLTARYNLFSALNLLVALCASIWWSSEHGWCYLAGHQSWSHCRHAARYGSSNVQQHGRNVTDIHLDRNWNYCRSAHHGTAIRPCQWHAAVVCQSSSGGRVYNTGSNVAEFGCISGIDDIHGSILQRCVHWYVRRKEEIYFTIKQLALQIAQWA